MSDHLKGYAIAAGIFIVPSVVSMVVARLLGLKNGLTLIAIGTTASMLAGMFIMSAAGAMASAISRNEALLRGAGIGFIAGLVISLIVARVLPK